MKRFIFSALLLALALFLCGCGGGKIVGSWELVGIEIRSSDSEGVHTETTDPDESGAVVVYTFGKDGSYSAIANTAGVSRRSETGTYAVRDSYLSIVTPESNVTGIWRIDGNVLMLIMGESSDNATMYFERID